MLSTPRRRVAIALALAITLGTVGVFFGTNRDSQANDSANAHKDGGVCPGEVHYFAEDAPPGSNFFGPATEGEAVKKLLEELHDRRCLDPALVVGDAIDAQLPGFDRLNGDEAIAAKIREVRDDRELWRDTIATLEDQEEEADVEVTSMSGSYQTLYMVVGETDVPLIRQAAPDRPSYDVLRFSLPDGDVRNYKLDCGFQPVDQEFPGVPPLAPEKPPADESEKPERPRRQATPTTTTTMAPRHTDIGEPCAAGDPSCQPPGPNPGPTPGYEAGNAERVTEQQEQAANDGKDEPSPKGEPAPSKSGTPGETEGPNGTESGGNQGASDPEDTEGSDTDNNQEVDNPF